MSAIPIHCGCNQKNSNGTCPNCSRMRMAILLKNGCDHFKSQQPSGQLVSPIWYNHYRKNRESDEQIIKAMVRRFQKSVMFQFTNVLQFYDNGSKEPIAKITL